MSWESGPMMGQKWLLVRENRIVVIVDVTDCGMRVTWRYADEPYIYHSSDGLDFGMWKQFTYLEG